MTACFKLGQNITELLLRPIFIQMQHFIQALNRCGNWTVVKVRLFSNIGHVMPTIDLAGICTSSRFDLVTENENVHVHCCG